MAVQIVVPRLGWSMDEGTFSQWLKQDGARVHKGDMLFVIEGDKAAQEIESFDEGILRIAANAPQPGEAVKVGQVIGYLVAEGEPLPAPSAPAARSAEPVIHPKAGPAARRMARQLGVQLHEVAGTGRGGRITSSDVESRSRGNGTTPVLKETDRQSSTPRARRAARKLGVDLAAVVGTGRGGRVRERDVLGARPESSLPRAGGIRKTIAARLLSSLQATAPVTLNTRADATNLVNWQRRCKLPSDNAVAPTLTDALLRLTTVALAQHPQLNARWQNEQVAVCSQIHVGLAVDTEAGLLVPVIRNAERLNVQQIALQTSELARRARSGRLSADEMQGGTFTISNLGMYGIDEFTPIINWPEIAILGIGAIRREVAVLDNDAFAVRSRITFSLTFDHCAIDGAPAARFLQTLCRIVEESERWLE
jgi:pyruvate dehydrogenase E2 component (dihydrolipoamide acetyltransferase)